MTNIKIQKPEFALVEASPVEPTIISDNFFFLTSSSFSNDFSKGLMPTIYVKKMSKTTTLLYQERM